jgi:hypothetical protein
LALVAEEFACDSLVPGFPGFDSSLEMQRGALTLLGNRVYIPYGGYADGGNYRGTVIGVSLDGSQLALWATTSLTSGIWNPGGIASDGTNLYVVTGNAPSGTTPWGGSEAVIRLQPGPVFSGSTTDYWAPTNWQSLDSGDVDLGGTNPIIVDVPGATPSALVLAIGKDRNGYLLDRANLGGIIAPVARSCRSRTSHQFSGNPSDNPGHLRCGAVRWDIDRVQDNGHQSADDYDRLECEFNWAHLALLSHPPMAPQPDCVGIWTRHESSALFGYNGETGAVISPAVAPTIRSAARAPLIPASPRVAESILLATTKFTPL